MQVHEFNSMLDGYMLRKQKKDWSQAYHTALLLTALSGKGVTPQDVYYMQHPDEKPDGEDERNELLKSFGLGG
jgi:hypothetical protein